MWHAGSDVMGCRRPTGGVFTYVSSDRVTLRAFPVATPRGRSSSSHEGELNGVCLIRETYKMCRGQGSSRTGLGSTALVHIFLICLFLVEQSQHTYIHIKQGLHIKRNKYILG